MRFLPLLPISLALACGGCALFPHKTTADVTENENSRAIEQRRMRAVDHGDVTSERGAEILVADYTKQFDPSRSGVGAARSFGTGGARTKEFGYDQKVRADRFATKDFADSKANAAAERKYATSEANTRGKFKIPNSDKDVGNKTAETKDLPDGDKVAATKDLRDGDRQFLGQESKKLGRPVDPKDLADWRKGGSESVIYNAGSVDRIGTIKQLSIEDVRELLNKNK